ncbi:MAG: lysophospholipid acyltransferase family protein [Planctomycetota bacterium]|nr:lysophospholipid acyltransferase family protein [Planctomycetota bacterium]MDI6786997.1 lysophospholipid acyltransferase family protein [Planctomycetota bacterium]
MNLQSWRRIPVPKTIIFVVEYFVLRWVIFFLTALPLEMVNRLCRNLVEMIYTLDSRYKKIAINNILQAVPPVVPTGLLLINYPVRDVHSHSAADKIARASYEHFLLAFVHLLHLSRFKGIKNKKHIRFENTAVLDKAMSRNKGVILVTAHFGNWEIGVAELASSGHPISLIAFQQVNPYFNKMLNQFRESCGVNIIPTKGAISRCEELLKEGRIVVFVIDQTGREEGVEVEFFGRKSSAMWGPANLSLKTGAPIIPFSSCSTAQHITEFMCWVIKFRNTINYQPIGDKDQDIKRLTQLYLDEIEQIIREHPEQWIWFHRRWKRYRSPSQY